MATRSRLLTALIVAGCSAILLACGSTHTSEASDPLVVATTIETTTNSTAGTTVEVATQVGESDFTATLIDGTSITLSAQLAQHPVALWFWAPG